MTLSSLDFLDKKDGNGEAMASPVTTTMLPTISIGASIGTTHTGHAPPFAWAIFIIKSKYNNDLV